LEAITGFFEKEERTPTGERKVPTLEGVHSAEEAEAPQYQLLQCSVSKKMEIAAKVLDLNQSVFSFHLRC
jgi:hypothetical protein